MSDNYPKQWQFLVKSVALGKLSHAYLFSGPETRAKGELARDLARFVNCQDNDFQKRPCAVCPSCLEFAKSCHPDFLWSQVAEDTESQINLIRAANLWLDQKPILGRWKVAVVNDVQVFSAAAQSALLKTLEEPPASSLLILIQNNGEILPTLVSRTQEIKFPPLSRGEILEILSENDRLRSLAFVWEAGLKSVFDRIKAISEEDQERRQFFFSLVNFLHLVFLLKAGALRAENLGPAREKFERVTEKFSTRQLKDFLDFSSSAGFFLGKTNASPRLVLENLVLNLF